VNELDSYRGSSRLWSFKIRKTACCGTYVLPHFLIWFEPETYRWKLQSLFRELRCRLGTTKGDVEAGLIVDALSAAGFSRSQPGPVEVARVEELAAEFQRADDAGETLTLRDRSGRDWITYGDEWGYRWAWSVPHEDDSFTVPARIDGFEGFERFMPFTVFTRPVAVFRGAEDSEAPELFPGTRAALDALTIRTEGGGEHAE
jgi:hypothetical protein